MIQTFTLLLLAHLLAQLVPLPGGQPARALGSAVLFAALAALFLGSPAPPLALLGLAYAAVGLIEYGATLRWPRPSPRSSLNGALIRQTLLIAALATVAVTRPGLWVTGAWAGQPLVPTMAALASGFLIGVPAGGRAIGLFMAPWAGDAPEGLKNGGRTIGHLERTLIFLFTLTGQLSAIGLLIAAKSILRFGAVKDDLKLSEYVIIGTLLSFVWGILTALLTLALMGRMAPLHIPTLAP